MFFLLLNIVIIQSINQVRKQIIQTSTMCIEDGWWAGDGVH